MERCKIAITDDHVLFAQSLEVLINGFEGCEVLFIAKTGKELIDKLKGAQEVPDIILLDYNMPEMNGYEAMLWISENMREIHVLSLTMEEDDRTIIKMLRAGAKGYLLKKISSDTLKKAFDEVLECGFYHSEHVAAKYREYQNGEPETNLLEDLKKREIEFLNHACTEKTYKEIAEDMCLSPKTVDNYRDNMFKKLNVKSRVGMVLYAIRNDIVSTD